MTKTLTQKWKDETLESGFYWIEVDVGGGRYIDIVEYDEDTVDFNRYWTECIKKVIAKVPSYDEFKSLEKHAHLSKNLVYEVLIPQKEYNELLDKAKEHKRLQTQLAIATKALKIIERMYSWNGEAAEVAEQTLKEIEEAK